MVYVIYLFFFFDSKIGEIIRDWPLHLVITLALEVLTISHLIVFVPGVTYVKQSCKTDYFIY